MCAYRSHMWGRQRKAALGAPFVLCGRMVLCKRRKVLYFKETRKNKKGSQLCQEM